MEIIRDMFRGTPECPDTDYLTERVKTLSNELSRCVGPIDITEKHQASVQPHYILGKYDLVIADYDYLLYTIDDWSSIIARLHRQLGEKYEWTKSVYDCDDIALLYASTLAYSAYRAGLSKQPAFAIAWSDKHAFNLLIDDNKTVWLVEPQTGSIIGRLNNNYDDMYDVKKIWFLS